MDACHLDFTSDDLRIGLSPVFEPLGDLKFGSLNPNHSIDKSRQLLEVYSLPKGWNFRKRKPLASVSDFYHGKIKNQLLYSTYLARQGVFRTM